MYKKLEIMIDARIVNENLNGIARYTYEIIKNISRKNNIHIRLLVNDMKVANNVFGKFNNIEFIKMKSQFLSLFEQIELPYVVNKYKDVDVFHSPSFVASPFIKCNMIMTIHDLTHIKYKSYATMFRKLYYKFIVMPCARKSVKILTVSEFSKKEIVDWLNCDENKVIVTYNGIDNNFKIINDESELNNVKKKYKLPEEFILYIGNLKPHKNVETLIKAIAIMKKNIILILNGKVNEKFADLIKKLNIRDKIQFIGYIDDEDLPAIYNLASVFVFPSFYEGFGFPPLEALACGCKVITSNTTSLPEVVFDADSMVNPYSALNFADAIEKALNNENIQIDNNTKERLKKFSWIAASQSTYEVYKTCQNIK